MRDGKSKVLAHLTKARMSDNSFIIQLVIANQKAYNPVVTAIVRGTFILKIHFTYEIAVMSSSISNMTSSLNVT